MASQSNCSAGTTSANGIEWLDGCRFVSRCHICLDAIAKMKICLLLTVVATACAIDPWMNVQACSICRVSRYANPSSRIL